MATLCRIFAGKTKPFTRVCGAAYSFIDVTRSIDMSRLFFHYFKDEGIEIPYNKLVLVSKAGAPKDEKK